MKRKNSIFRHLIMWSISILVLLGLYTVSTIYSSKNFIEVTTYEYPSDKINEEVNFIVISDAHAHEFGKDNNDLINKVKNEEPDAILLVGDIINFYEKSTVYLTELIAGIKDIAPVYYTIGNHESAYMSKSSVNIESVVESAGAIYLDQEY